MRRSYALTRAAQHDLEELGDYIATRDGWEVAERVLSKFTEAFRRIAATPGLGHVHQDIGDESLLVKGVYSYLVVYDPRPSPLCIVRVVYGGMDLTNQPFERE